MEKPGFYNITAYQGATFDQQFIWKIDSTPVNLSTYSARMQVRRDFKSSVVIVELLSGDEITLGNAGQIDLYLDADTTANLPGGNYIYDIELESSSGEVTRLLQGEFTVSPEVTR